MTGLSANADPGTGVGEGYLARILRGLQGISIIHWDSRLALLQGLKDARRDKTGIGGGIPTRKGK